MLSMTGKHSLIFYFFRSVSCSLWQSFQLSKHLIDNLMGHVTSREKVLSRPSHYDWYNYWHLDDIKKSVCFLGENESVYIVVIKEVSQLGRLRAVQQTMWLVTHTQKYTTWLLVGGAWDAYKFSIPFKYGSFIFDTPKVSELLRPQPVGKLCWLVRHAGF